MNLDEITSGVPVTVQLGGGERPFRRRLMELGILPGTVVLVRRTAPLGDPLELEVRGGLLSIRKAEARCIAVAPATVSARTPSVDRGAVEMRPGLPASS